MKEMKIFGMNPIVWLASCAIIILCTYLGLVPKDMVGAFAICFGFGTIMPAIVGGAIAYAASRIIERIEMWIAIGLSFIRM